MGGLTLYPAIDIKAGACVRLRRGAMDEATVYGTDPAAQARAWAEAGCRWLHVVDLDGAIAGRAINADAVAAILRAVAIPVQLGGGIRDLAAVSGWLEAGVQRVILGSAAAKAPNLVKEACARYPGRIIVGIDVREGRVAVEGWVETTETAVADVALRAEEAGAAAVIFTDIGRDGMLTGVAIEPTVRLAERLSIPLIASGGVGSIDDIIALKTASQGLAVGTIEGVIVGRALYDGRLAIPQALAALAA
jgi:phosphoribosylformimino-5-aminoimidazole carboxamide ribotide isomerase